MQYISHTHFIIHIFKEKLQAINIELSEVSGKFEHATVVHIEDKLRLEKRILELEQMVDELERGRRADQAALQSTEGRLSSTLEQMALMGTELETKAQLEMDMQRARDELRDCKNEIEALRARQLTSDTIEHPSEDTVMKEPSQSNENTQEILACLKVRMSIVSAN